MKKDCVLIATLPSLSNTEKVEKIFQNPYISEVRFNTGQQVPFTKEKAIECLYSFSKIYHKKLWIDIKGRQLRVTKWADPLYSCIEINHKINVVYPATIAFRNGDTVNLSHIKDGNKLFVDPLPREAVGAGQSVNIIAARMTVDGYLTPSDIEYLNICKRCNMDDLNNIMASFVESYDDLTEILKILPKANIVSKIESMEGISFISEYPIGNLMAARDDLYIQTGQNSSMLNHLKTIISRDKGAICASKIFSSLEKRETVDFADFADLELMYQLGYRKFMLCDNICNFRFKEAIKAWEEFING